MVLSKFLRKRDMYLRRLQGRGRRSGKSDNIGTALLIYRIQKGLTQNQLAILLGCTRPQLCCWEKGRYAPMKSRLESIKKIINIIPTNYCEIGSCNGEAERAHLITRAVLAKELWEDENFFVWMCRRHHEEFHQIGVESFCAKYELVERLEKAKKLWAEFSL